MSSSFPHLHPRINRMLHVRRGSPLMETFSSLMDKHGEREMNYTFDMHLLPSQQPELGLTFSHQIRNYCRFASINQASNLWEIRFMHTNCCSIMCITLMIAIFIERRINGQPWWGWMCHLIALSNLDLASWSQFKWATFSLSSEKRIDECQAYPSLATDSFFNR